MAHPLPDAAPSPATPAPLQRLASMALMLAAAVFVIFPGLSAIYTLLNLAAIATIPGEFSHGEAGKAFYAWRWRSGQSLFLGADQPPHYPSFHGPALHVVAGTLAWLLDLSRDQMMAAGRGVSVVGLAGVCGVMIVIGRRLGMAWPMAAGALVVFFSNFGVHTASTTYRPDTLMVLCSAATCLVFLDARGTVWGRALLVVLPVLGYLFKPLGLSAAAATVLAFVVMREWRAAVIHAVSFAAALLLAVGALQWWSGGLYLRSLSEGVRVEFGWEFLRSWLPAPTLAVPVLVALAAAGCQATRAESPQARAVAVVGAYLALALAAALVGTLRAGAYFYYYLETFAFASVLAMWAAAQLPRIPAAPWRLAATMAAIIAMIVVWRSSCHLAFAGPWIANQKIPAALEAERRQLLAFAREKNVRIFTNDPVLAVRLDDQAILYTSLMRQLIDAGTLDPESYRAPLREGRWPVMALLNEGLPHNHAVTVDRLPDFDQSMALYEPVPWPGVMYRTYRFKQANDTPAASGS